MIRNAFIHKILHKFFKPFWQITQRVSPYGLVVSIFMRGAYLTVLLVLSLPVRPVCNVGTAASCNTDVEDVGLAQLAELVDKPDTTIGT